MDVNIPCGEKFDPSNEPSMVDAKWGRQKKSFKIYIWLPWETCMRYAKRPCCFIVEVRNCRTDFPNFWRTVCSRWRRSANDQWRTVLNYKKKKKKKKRILNAPLPIYLSSNVSTVRVTTRTSARWVKLNGAVSRSHTFTARANCEPTEFTESVHNSLTQKCRLNGRDCQAERSGLWWVYTHFTFALS